MGVYYLDSSALVKRYAQEAGSSWVASLTDTLSANSIFIALVTGAEIVAAVTRKVRTGAIALHDAQVTLTAFKSHFKTEYLVVLVHAAVVATATR